MGGYNKRPDQGGPQKTGKPYGGGGRGQGQNRMMGNPMQQHMGPMQNQMNMQSNQQQMEMMR